MSITCAKANELSDNAQHYVPVIGTRKFKHYTLVTVDICHRPEDVRLDIFSLLSEVCILRIWTKSSRKREFWGSMGSYIEIDCPHDDVQDILRVLPLGITDSIPVITLMQQWFNGHIDFDKTCSQRDKTWISEQLAKCKEKLENYCEQS